MRRKRVVAVLLILGALGILFRPYLRRGLTFAILRVTGRKTVGDRLAEYGPAARERLAPFFRRAGVAYPPGFLKLVGLKRERRVEVYAGRGEQDLRHIRSYPILAASGGSGPKLREGDRQVPEGIYRIEALNPNSLYHLSLRLNYPSPFDRQMAVAEGRQNLGQDIMIHGDNASVGCLAMGDAAAEDLFVLAADTGIERIRVILSPEDFRARSALPSAQPAWVTGLYQEISGELERLPRP